MVKKEVSVKLSVIDSFSKGLDKFAIKMKKVSQDVITTGKRASSVFMQNAKMQKSQSDILAQSIARRNGVQAKNVTLLRKTNGTLTQAVPKVKKFKMEWLGVMFAGMAMYRVFGGLIKAQMDLFGVSDMLSATWTTVLLPVMEMITPLIMSILEKFMDLPDGVKKAIGIFILLATAIGAILMVGGQMMLGIQAMSMAFGGVGGVINSVGTALIGLSATAMIVIGVIVTIVIGMYLAWKSNFLGMRKVVSVFWDGVKRVFGGMIQFFKGILQLLIGLFTGDFRKIGEGIKNIFSGLWKFLTGGFEVAFTAIGAIIIGALKVAYNMIKALIDGVGWLVGKVGKLFGGSGKPAFTMPSFKTGGIMPNDGVAYLHKGERILTAGETRQDANASSSGMNVTINASVSSDYDVRRMADKLKEYWVSDFERVSQGRSV